MPEKAIVDAFKSVFPRVQDGPAAEFFTGGPDGLDRAIAMVQIVVLDRQGANPYRADLIDKLEGYVSVPIDEVIATQHLLNVVKSIRKATAPAQAPTVAIANDVSEPSSVDLSTLGPAPELTGSQTLLSRALKGKRA